MKIIEHIKTIQGEGRHAGQPCELIRFPGCILRCDFCDTKYSWDSNPSAFLAELNSEKRIEEYIEKNIPKKANVVISGGEPLMSENFKELSKFTRFLVSDRDCCVTIETTGLTSVEDIKTSDIVTNLNIFYMMFPHVLFSISPKLNTSFYRNDDISYLDILKFYRISENKFIDLMNKNIDYYYKFVYKNTYERYISGMINPFIETYMMPWTPIDKRWDKDTYKPSCEETVEYSIRKQVNYSPRIHIDIWGPVIGK